MLTDRRHRPQMALLADELSRRRGQRHVAIRRADRHATQLRVLRELRDRIDAAESDLCRTEPLRERVGSRRPEFVRDDTVEGRRVLDASDIAVEALVGSDGGVIEDVGAELRPFALVLDRDQDELSVL
jgi:hypothetical protein